ncbi:hypothetical protein NQ318_016304 [Aromia moschata]|uniref:alanine--tRNA ligase n=1 Tax=Aromia moschata TaxID=1265417 RepID=A0AAV8Z5C2_9CUCU|nr:hypothetical protein NQ318_016304 [Aromia moschata]
MERNIRQIHQIIDYEEDIYKSLRKVTETEWKKLIKDDNKLLEIDLDSELAFKLYDTYGLDEEAIIKMCDILHLNFDPEDLTQELERTKFRSKESTIYTEDKLYSLLVKENAPKTDDSFKYNYFKVDDKYEFKDLKVNVLKIFQGESLVPEIDSGYYCTLLLDKTNLYSEAGGQISDNGAIDFENGSFEIVTVENVNGYIFHKGFFKSKDSKLKANVSGVLNVNEEFRLNCMRNHTTTHLLNAVLKKKMRRATCQKSSKVTDKYLVFDVAIFSDKLGIDEIDKVEQHILNIIKSSQPVDINVVDSQQLLNYDFVTLIPGETYPQDGIRIVEVKDNEFISREPCCGTHVLNTKDIEDFCIVHIKSLGRSTISISAREAKLARLNAAELTEEIDTLTKNIDDNIDKPDLLAMIISTLRRKLNYSIDSDDIIPICARHKCIEKLDAINKQLKDVTRENLRDLIEVEMQNVLDSSIKTTKSNNKYIVHYLRSSMVLETVPLQKATKLCPNIPILVISYADNMVKARCCVPKRILMQKNGLKNRQLLYLKVELPHQKDKMELLICNMKAKKVHVQDWDPLLNECLEKAEKYVEDYL